MEIFKEIEFKNVFGKLSSEFYTKQSWTSLEDPCLIAFNKSLALELGFDVNLDAHEMVKIFNGEMPIDNAEPLAMGYPGQHVGSWVSELGDGRGILFGQVQTLNGLRDLHIKGAGKTPYSRFADGRAVLRLSLIHI